MACEDWFIKAHKSKRWYVTMCRYINWVYIDMIIARNLQFILNT